MAEADQIIIEKAKLLDFDFRGRRHLTIIKDDTSMKVYLTSKDKTQLREAQDEMNAVRALKGSIVDLIVVPNRWELQGRSGTIYYLVSIEEHVEPVKESLKEGIDSLKKSTDDRTEA